MPVTYLYSEAGGIKARLFKSKSAALAHLNSAEAKKNGAASWPTVLPNAIHIQLDRGKPVFAVLGLSQEEAEVWYCKGAFATEAEADACAAEWNERAEAAHEGEDALLFYSRFETAHLVMP